jgi:hypothetical protein
MEKRPTEDRIGYLRIGYLRIGYLRIGYLSITASETEQKTNLRTPKERKFHIGRLPKDV